MSLMVKIVMGSGPFSQKIAALTGSREEQQLTGSRSIYHDDRSYPAG